MASEGASQHAFFGISALLLAASTAVTSVWCTSMSAMALRRVQTSISWQSETHAERPNFRVIPAGNDVECDPLKTLLLSDEIQRGLVHIQNPV